jgi:serine protease Do
MNAWKTAAVAAALVGVAGAGAAFFPPAHAQVPARVTAPRALEILAGRGSQIGASIRDVDEDDAKGARLAAQTGVVIEDVTEDSPAAKAGLKKGDVVVEFDGERVRSVRQFTRLVQETPAGRKTATSVMRDGQKVNLTVEPRESNGFDVFGSLDSARVLGDFGRDVNRDFNLAIPTPARPARPGVPAPPAPPAAPMFPDVESFVWRSGNGNGLGISAGDLSDQLASYFGTKDGVLVTSVTDNSAAAKAGVKAGDVITSFNGTEVTTPSDLRRRVQRLQDGDEFTVGVVRDRKSLTLKGKLETVRPRRTYRAQI